MEVFLGATIGGLVPTYLINRLFYWILRGWKGYERKAVAVNLLSMFSVWLIVGETKALSAGTNTWDSQAGLMYVLPQLFWTIFDFYMARKKYEADFGKPVKRVWRANDPASDSD
jgi:hypothetical protein